MKIRYLSTFLLILVLTPIASGSVTDLQVSPAQPEQGDLIELAVIADPFETVDVDLELVRELTVVNGNYILRVNDIEIPQTPNEFSVRVYDVLTMNVAALGMTLSPSVSSGEGYIAVPNLPPGQRDVKISGYAEAGETTVTCEINAWTQVTMDVNGEFHDTYDLGDVPPGDVVATVGGMTKTVTIYPRDNTPPVISGMQPNDEISTENPVISASYSDFFGINTNSVTLELNEDDVTSQASITSSGFTYSASSLGNNTNHQVRLVVSDTKGNSASKNWSFDIKLDPLPDVFSPSIANTQPSGIIMTTSTQILASLSDNRRVETATVSVKLNQQDITGTAQITQNSIVCPLSGLSNNTLYTIDVSVSDKAGNTASEQWSFTVQLPPVTTNPNPPTQTMNVPPEPHIQGPSFVILGDVFRLDGSKSIDKDGIITQYLWDLGDGTTKTGPIIVHNYQTSGEKSVQLSTTDNRGRTISTTQTVTVYDVEDYSINARPGSSRTVFTGQRVTLDGSTSTSMGGIITQYLWNLGDSISMGEKINHVFMVPGVYNISLIVTDQRWMSNTAYVRVNVIDPPIMPSVREETIINNTTSTYRSLELETNVTVTSTGETSVLLLEYSQNPYPSKPTPINSLGRVKDISISNPDSIDWPIFVEINVNSTLDLSVAARLGLYWFNGTNWSICHSTGFNHTSRTIWAYMTRVETSGSPIIPAVRPTPADIVVTNILSSSQITEIGETIDLLVYLENRGDLLGSYEGELELGNIIIPFSVSIEGHETYLYQYKYVPVNSGNLTISVESIQTDLEIRPLPADLYVDEIILLHDTIYVDEVFRVNASIGNRGDSNAKNIIVQLIIDDIIYGQETIPRIQQEEIVSITFRISLHKVQQYTATCLIDPLNKELELDETNNEAVFTVDMVKKPFNSSYLLLGLVAFAVIIYYYRVRYYN